MDFYFKEKKISVLWGAGVPQDSQGLRQCLSCGPKPAQEARYMRKPTLPWAGLLKIYSSSSLPRRAPDHLLRPISRSSSSLERQFESRREKR